jgi:hypothetical protein
MPVGKYLLPKEIKHQKGIYGTAGIGTNPEQLFAQQKRKGLHSITIASTCLHS